MILINTVAEAVIMSEALAYAMNQGPVNVREIAYREGLLRVQEVIRG